MASHSISGLIREPGIRVVVVDVKDVARKASESHGLLPAASAMLAQGFAAGALLAALQKENQPINLQLECDGPLRGLFVDAQPDGSLRGYVKNRYVEFEGDVGEYRFRPILGNKGFLSVLRDIGGGEFYRSSVELLHFDLSFDLHAYFAQSEQALTEVRLFVEGSPISHAYGVLLQTLPGGDVSVLQGLAQRAFGAQGVNSILRPEMTAKELAEGLFSDVGFTLMSEVGLEFRCRCSHEKVMGALRMLGASELTDILAKEGKAEATCHFCGQKYTASSEELRALLSMLQAADKN